MSTDSVCARVSDDVVLYILWLTKEEVELLALMKRLYIDCFIRILMNGKKSPLSRANWRDKDGGTDPALKELT